MTTVFTRRRLLRDFAVAGAAGLGLFNQAGSQHGLLFSAEADTPRADQLIAGKDSRLIVHKAAPCEIETPAQLLAQHNVTPKELLFVRNNQQLADSQTLAPPKLDDWIVELTGLVEYPRKVQLDALRQMPSIEQEMVLQCSGNGRKFFSQAAACSGAPWQVGAVANVRFGGVPLKYLVEQLKCNVDPRARFVTAEGSDGPPKSDGADFEHSLPLDEVLERSLLALTLNGGPLPAVHGGPVRLVTPGYYGTMHVKWLSRLRFETAETANHHQVRRYRTPREPISPGAAFEYDLANSEPNWRMRIKSMILTPGDGAELTTGKVEFRGVAFNDGSCRIDRVEISTDGDNWRRVELKTPQSPYAWYPWRSSLELPRGISTIRCRAIDALGRTQPLDGSIHWNPAGYAWNGIHAVQVTAR